MNSKLSSVLSLPAFMLMSCVSEFHAKLSSNDTQVLVIDGSIIENTDAAFYLSKSFPFDSPGVPEESRNIDAKLTIIDSNGNQSQPARNVGKGEYRISVGALDDDMAYGIEIEYDGNTYRSALSKPLRTPEIDSVSFIQPEIEGDVIIRVSTHDNTEGTMFFIWNYTEDWEIRAKYRTTVFYNPENDSYYENWLAPYYYCWKKATSDKLLIGSTKFLGENRIINKELYRLDPADERFIEVYSVTLSQKVISQGAYEYYQDRIKLNEEMGGLFTPQPSEVNGNISCITNPSKRVMGYVETVKNTTQKRTFIFQKDISRPDVKIDCPSSIDYFDSDIDRYNAGRLPAEYPILSSECGCLRPNYGWERPSCTDCRADGYIKGGTKNKPDFWPNDHE